MKIERLATISEKHLPILREYFEILRLRWETPYSWLNPIDLLSGMKIGFVEDCLIVFTHKCAGYYTMKLLFPPVSKSGDLMLEDRVISFLLSQGISILSYENDTNVEYQKKWKVGGFQSKQVMIERCNAETLLGSKYKNIRQRLRKYERLCSQGEIEITIQNDLLGTESCFNRWSKNRFNKIISTYTNAQLCSKYFDLKVIVFSNKERVIACKTLLPYNKSTFIGCSVFGEMKNMELNTNHQTFLSFPHLEHLCVGGSYTRGVFNAKTRTPHKAKCLYRIPPEEMMGKVQWHRYKEEIAKTDFLTWLE